MISYKLLVDISEQILLENFKYSRLVDWAINNLKNGIETENMLILSSLSYNENASEILNYFSLALKENKLQLPIIEFDKAMDKVKYYVNAMNKKYITPIKTLTYLKNLCIEENYDINLLPFYNLDDEIDYFLHENENIFKKQTNTKNLENYIFKNINIEFHKINNAI